MTAAKLSRRKFLQTLALQGAGGVAVAWLGGCAPARRAAEIRLAASAAEVQDEWIERFNRQFSPHRVTRVSLDWKNLRNSLAAPGSADVAALPAADIPWLGHNGVLRDLSDLFDRSQQARQADLFGVDSYFTNDARRWGLALSWSPDYLVWVNAQLWQAAGVAVPDGALTLAEWRALSKRLARVEQSGLPVFGTDFHFNFAALLWLAETLDPPARLFSEGGGELRLTADQAFVQAVRFVLDWKKEGGIPYRRPMDPYQSNLPDCT